MSGDRRWLKTVGRYRQGSGKTPPATRTGLWFPFEKGKHLDPWWMALVPVAEAWEVPLAFAYGNWNDCPSPELHAAMCLRWQSLYGAELVAVGHATLEFIVDSPPTNREAAMALAWEQYLYCADLVEQGIGTISALGASLVGNSTWSFWWD